MNTNIVYIVDKVWQSWQNNSLRSAIVSNHFWAKLYHNELWSHLYFMIYVTLWNYSWIRFRLTRTAKFEESFKINLD